MIFLFCIIVTSIAYFTVFHPISYHQQQVNANESAQNFGQPVIDFSSELRHGPSIFLLKSEGVVYL